MFRLSSADLRRARQLLRDEQSPGQGAGAFSLVNITAQTVERFREITAIKTGGRSGRVRRGVFNFDEALERKRIKQGEQIIRRVNPGPHEDPNYLALLAPHAASIELAADEFRGGWFDHYLLGTVHAADVNAFSHRSSTDRHVVVVLNSGLIEFMYQAARAAVEATQPRLARADEAGSVVATGDRDDVRAFLDRHDGPMKRLHRTLDAAFFDGYPRARAPEPPPPGPHGPPLSFLIGMAERFVVGHEYGHGQAPALGPDAGPAEHRAEEHFADRQGIIWTVHSAVKFDNVEPVFALGGALFMLTCLDVRRRALSVLLTGDESAIPAQSHSHPAPEARMAAMLAGFDQHFRFDDSANTAKLSLVPQSDGKYLTRERLWQANTYPEILEMIWKQVRPRLVDDYLAGRPLHPMWH